jgi:hypothetical protein
MLLVLMVGAALAGGNDAKKADAKAADKAPDFTPSLQVRPRLETHTGRDGDSDTESALMVSQRARVGGTMKFGDASAKVIVQDIRVWGMETNTLTDPIADIVDFHEAYVTWKPHKAVNFKVGRQEVAIHEHRLVGTVDWAQQGRSFDGGRFSLKNENLSMDLFSAILKEGDLIDVEEKDINVTMLRAGYAKKKEGVQADVLAVLDNDGELELSRQTVGVYAKGKTGILSGRVEGYYQMGSLGDADIGAWMAGVRATVAPDMAGKPTFTLWYDQLSGDDDMTDSDIKAFNTLYATNHKFYGHMDIAGFGVASAADGRGLQDIALKVAAKPVKGLGVNVDLHQFMFSDDQGGDEGSLGQEADVWGKYAVNKHFAIAAGGAVFMPAADDTDNDMWGWLQLDAKY